MNIIAAEGQGRNYRGGLGGCLTPPIFRNGTLVGQKLRKGLAKLQNLVENHFKLKRIEKTRIFSYFL